MNLGMTRKQLEERQEKVGGDCGDVECRWMKGSWRVGERRRDLERRVAWGKFVKSKRGMF